MSLDLLHVISEGFDKKGKTKPVKRAENVEGLKDTWVGEKEGNKQNALTFARMVSNVK